MTRGNLENDQATLMNDHPDPSLIILKMKLRPEVWQAISAELIDWLKQSETFYRAFTKLHEVFEGLEGINRIIEAHAVVKSNSL